MITHKDLRVGMEVEARSRKRTGKRWLPARVVEVCGAFSCAYVHLVSDVDGESTRGVYRTFSKLRLKPEGRGR